MGPHTFAGARGRPCGRPPAPASPGVTHPPSSRPPCPAPVAPAAPASPQISPPLTRTNPPTNPPSTLDVPQRTYVPHTFTPRIRIWGIRSTYRISQIESPGAPDPCPPTPGPWPLPPARPPSPRPQPLSSPNRPPNRCPNRCLPHRFEAPNRPQPVPVRHRFTPRIRIRNTRSTGLTEIPPTAGNPVPTREAPDALAFGPRPLPTSAPAVSWWLTMTGARVSGHALAQRSRL
jgi:hypothetical protein